LIQQIVLIIGPILVLIATPSVLTIAKRKELISSSTVLASAGFWILAAIALLLFWPTALPFTVTAILISLAALALVVIPLGAAPLALAANRHR
jgi:hypothetical protein